MTKNDRTEKSGNDQQSNGSKQRSSNSGAPSAQTKAVLKIRQATENNRYVDATFTDSKGKEAKELIQTFRDSNPGELLIEFEKQLLKLGAHYALFKEGKWKVLGQLGGRSLGGRIERIGATSSKERRIMPPEILPRNRQNLKSSFRK
jgi:hypothetical protein